MDSSNGRSCKPKKVRRVLPRDSRHCRAWQWKRSIISKFHVHFGEARTPDLFVHRANTNTSSTSHTLGTYKYIAGDTSGRKAHTKGDSCRSDERVAVFKAWFNQATADTRRGYLFQYYNIHPSGTQSHRGRVFSIYDVTVPDPKIAELPPIPAEFLRSRSNSPRGRSHSPRAVHPEGKGKGKEVPANPPQKASPYRHQAGPIQGPASTNVGPLRSASRSPARSASRSPGRRASSSDAHSSANPAARAPLMQASQTQHRPPKRAAQTPPLGQQHRPAPAAIALSLRPSPPRSYSAPRGRPAPPQPQPGVTAARAALTQANVAAVPDDRRQPVRRTKSQLSDLSLPSYHPEDW